MFASQTLPDDVLYSIFCHLSATDVLIVRKVCASFKRVTEGKHLWLMIVSRDVYPEIVPSYIKPFDALSAHQTEILALHLLRVQSAATSGPKPVICYPFHQPRTVTWVHILQGAWLLIAACDSMQSVLSLWSVPAILCFPGTVVPPAAEAYLHGPVANGKVLNNGRTNSPKSRDCSIEVLSLRSEAGKPIFVRLAHLVGASRLRCLTNHLVVFALLDELSIPCLMDWRSGAVIKLHNEPQHKGGCVAMAVDGDIAAIVTPGKLEIHILTRVGTPASSSRKVCEFDLPNTFTYAELMFNTPSQHESSSRPIPTLRLLLSRHDEVRVFEVMLPRLEDIHFRHIWRHNVGNRHDASRPSFGASLTFISDFVAKKTHWEPVVYMTTYVPLRTSLADPGPLEQPPTPQAFSVPDMPALYAMCVRDHDETRGLALFGNAFGELTLFDFSGSDPVGLADCFLDTPFPDFAGDDGSRMPTTPITPVLAPPFPYNGPEIPTQSVRDALFDLWRPHLPAQVPEGWTTDLLSSTVHPDKAPWHRWTCMLGSYSCSLEPGLHILGTKIPLMVANNPHMTVFKSGGLLYLEHEAWDCVFVLNEGDTVDDVPPVLHGEGGPLPETRLYGDATSWRESTRFKDMWAWEWYTHNRNRWQEMKDRGGDVDQRWTRGRPYQRELAWEASPEPTDTVDTISNDGSYGELRATLDYYSSDSDDPWADEDITSALPAFPTNTDHSPSPSPIRAPAVNAPNDREDLPAKEGILAEADPASGERSDIVVPLQVESPSTIAPSNAMPSAVACASNDDSSTVDTRRPRRAETTPPRSRDEAIIAEEKLFANRATVVESTTSSGSGGTPVNKAREEEEPAYRRDLARRAVRRRFTD